MRLAPRGGLVLAVVLAVGIVATSVGAAVAIQAQEVQENEDAPVEVDRCGTITSPGEYVLTADLRAAPDRNCIEIRASDVVLDGDGHAIVREEVESDTVGIDVNGSDGRIENVAVRNVTVANWGVGLRFENVASGSARRVSASDAAANGVQIGRSEGTRLSEVVSVGNGNAGIYVNESDETDLREVRVADNEHNGVFLRSADESRLRNVTTVENRNGIRAVSSDDLRFADVRAENNSFNGITMVGVDDGRFREITATDNQNGVRFINARDNRIADLVADENDDWAYVARAGSSITRVSNATLGDARVSFESGDVALAPESDPPPEPRGYEAVGTHLRVENTSASPYLLVRVHYSEDDVDAAGVSEDSLRMATYQGDWYWVAEVNGVDTDDDVVYARITDSGIVVPLAESA